MADMENSQDYYNKVQEAYNLGVQDASNSSHSGAAQSSSVFGGTANLNLIQWQLELDNILERIDHLLRGHELKFDNQGNLTWLEATKEENKLFNEYGVQEILRILSMYLNRNTILSNYDEETINWKVYDFGIEITDLIFMKYEQMGLDSPEKIKLYPMICKELIDTIHSSYLRALNGGERQSLREARHVTQNEPIGYNGMNQGMMGQNTNFSQAGSKPFSLFKPSSWIRR